MLVYNKFAMQLPRGSFRTIIKREMLGSVLNEIERSNFSGISSISSDNFVCTLVFRSGRCVLAESRTDVGDAAWEKVQTDSGIEIDAAFSDLDQAQLQLSLDYNKKARVIRGVLGSPPAKKQKALLQSEISKKPAHAPASPPVIKKEPKNIQKSSHKSSQPHLSLDRVVTKATPHPDAAPPEKLPSEKERTNAGSHKTAFEKDIDIFDTMNLEHMTEKIRKDCQIAVKQLQLEYLIEI